MSNLGVHLLQAVKQERTFGIAWWTYLTAEDTLLHFLHTGSNTLVFPQ